ncbi:tetratricopeptide repeat protein [Methanosarcina sp. UBA411]|jgi:tetratricopeptide (TPR) repeat protein|uniref:tetratricopeptide repeat protein n=1 Tax=Methanosarcina sp. UBA411 TaxID=1915589 RepID=UPI0025FF0502|nr:tetratricopeptide repeat protein [Methanosarcina sp. UBA411]
MFDWLQSLKDDDEIAIFAGAGISKDSGLPLANELKRLILSKLMAEKEDIEEITHSGMPFEYFTQCLPIEISEKIFKIFKYGEPNTNHLLIAKLAKLGIVKNILTTNFDLLFEKALKGEKLDFSTYYTDNDFAGVDLENSRSGINLFKIHGSIENYESLKHSLNKVGKGFTPNEKNIMDYLFLNGSHDKVIVLGYSCSDKFDINPYLQSLANNKKRILIVQHDEVYNSFDRIDELIDLGVNTPFYSFDGIRTICNTRTFIEYFWNIYEKEIGCFIDRKSTLKWEIYINSWGKNIRNCGIREIVAGELFNSISSFDKAKKYYLKSLAIATRCKDPYLIYHGHLSFGKLSHQLQEYDDAFFHFNKALEAIDNHDFGSNHVLAKNEFAKAYCKANCYSCIGQAYAAVENYKEAVRNYNLGLNIYKLLGDDQEARVYMELGMCYEELGNIDNAFKYMSKSLEMKKIIGDLIGIANCYSNLIKLYRVNDPLKSIQCGKKAIEYFEKIGKKSEIGMSYVNLSITYNHLNQVEDELKCLKKAEEIFSQCGHSSHLTTSLKYILAFASRENDHGLKKEYEEKIKVISSSNSYSFD